MANALFHAWVFDLQTVGGTGDVPVAYSNAPYKIKYAGTGTIIAQGNANANGEIAVDLGAGVKIVDVYVDDIIRLEDVEHTGSEYG